MILSRARINSFVDFDLVITYERSTIDFQRISGHIFEAFDYWLHLTTYTDKKIAIVIPDDVPYDMIKKAYEDKYVIPDRDGVGYDFEDIPIWVDANYKNIVCNKILHCSGFAPNEQVSYFGDIISFRCGKPPQEGNSYTLLQDTRVYSDVPDTALCIHYIKKLPFEFYRRYPEVAENKVLLYDNTDLRKLTTNEIKAIQDNSTKDIIRVGSDIKLPVDNFMMRFNEYWYTPTAKNFDCSPRLIAECAFFGKSVMYLLPEGYLDQDKGLFFRRHDTQTNLMSLNLDDSDSIREIIFNFPNRLEKEISEQKENNTEGH